jgi:hypothetical protein
MKHRKLRIAWSMAWGIAAVLVVALWVRSYWLRDRITHNYVGRTYARFGYSIDSLRGRCSVLVIKHVPAYSPDRMQYVSWPADDTVSIAFPVGSLACTWLGFKWESSPDAFAIIVPYWFPLSAIGVLIAAMWVPWRFSLRTLLIATTLVAVGLGLIVWLR